MDPEAVAKERQEFLTYRNDRSVLAFTSETSNEGWQLNQPSTRELDMAFDSNYGDGRIQTQRLLEGEVSNWQILQADDLLVMFTCSQEDRAVNTDGVEKWSMDHELTKLKRIER